MNSSFDKELYRLFILDEGPGEKVMFIAKRLTSLISSTESRDTT